MSINQGDFNKLQNRLDLGHLQTELDRFNLTNPNVQGINEISESDELKDADKIFQRLNTLDWEFKDEDTSFLTHDIHPYPAKFIPHIPAQLIAHLSLRGELVLDPFGGSGTAAFEAIRLGRRAISIDANPIATLIAKVKTSKIGRTEILELLSLEKSLKSFINNRAYDSDDLIVKYAPYIPNIPNREKWFSDTSSGELAHIKYWIDQINSEVAKNIALLALSKVVLNVSFQESETRYTSTVRTIAIGDTTKRFLIALNYITGKVIQSEPSLHYGIINFITMDTLKISQEIIPNNSIDFIVTSPPYGNAYDYHLYHRFRLLWLGFNPKDLEKIEIGSHLRHQREKTGFNSYLSEMNLAINKIHQVLKPGRYAAIIIGDALYHGEIYNAAEHLGKIAENIGFREVGIISRQIHQTKRSMAIGRRAKIERILILKKEERSCSVLLCPPPYKLKEYESILRIREIKELITANPELDGNAISVIANPLELSKAQQLTFTHQIKYEKYSESTWQSKLENGLAISESSRKEPKYVTHGIHPYKGKFYPQLAKALINISKVKKGGIVLDPFCGSGTTLLECYLNGFQSYGCDMNPLAAKIASVKIGIPNMNPAILSKQISDLQEAIASAPEMFPYETDQFFDKSIKEIEGWFAKPVIAKINWLLKTIRAKNSGLIRDFFEIVLSSIIREISNQEPRDLRVRRRKEPLEDADVLQRFRSNLETQYSRIQRFWEIRGYSPSIFYSGRASDGDSRDKNSFTRLGLSNETVDLIITSPPYATALPYIDTDRLSLLILFGLNSADRRPLEHNLIGSREISNRQKNQMENIISKESPNLPASIIEFLISLQNMIKKSDAGFRRRNVPSLLVRFFGDMKMVLSNCYEILKTNGEIMIVIGDNTTTIDGKLIRIPTTDYIETIANEIGFITIERIPITVTKESMMHMKNAITENIVLRMKK